MTRGLLVYLALSVGCADRERDVTQAAIEDVLYAVPEGWSMSDVSLPSSTILVWTPAQNPRKQSVTIIRTQPMPAMARAGHDRLAANLGQTLRQPARLIRSKHGIEAARVDGRFRPPGMQASYARSHAVFADGDALIHVIYTAGDPDPAVFELVLDHIARKAG